MSELRNVSVLTRGSLVWVKANFTSSKESETDKKVEREAS